METLVDMLREAAARHGALPALSFHGGRSERWTWSYADLWEQARRTAAYLRDQGVATGDRVILWGPNRPEWVAAFFGAQLLGAIVVPLDLRSREDLLARLEEQTEPAHRVIGREQAKDLKGRHRPFTLLEELGERIAEATPIDVPERPVEPSDIAELVFTSGTTGNPKGVMLTHRNITANTAMGYTSVLPSPKNRVLSILPLSHMFEQTCGLFIPLSGGASITYVGSLRPDVIFDAMKEGHLTNMSCAPQVLELFKNGIMREVRKQERERQFERARRVARYLPMALRRRLFKQVHARMGGAFDFFVSGGAHLDPDLARWWESIGIKVVQGYGMTEAAPVVAAHSLTDRDAESVGRPLPGMSVKIVEDGEILVRGDNVTPGYWQNPEATAAAFADGWYQTGDLGYFDANGRLHLHGRKKNMIVLANGMNVYPEDVERVLTTDAAVKDAVVFGETKGQDVEVHAVLLLEKDAGDPAAIIRRANGRLGAYQKISGHTVWPDESFPLTPTLKAKRMDIMQRLEELRGEAVGSRQ